MSRERSAGNEADVFRGPSLIDPIYVIGKIWRAKWFVLFCALAGAGLAAGYSMLTPKLYTATTQVLVDPRDIKVVQNEVTPNGLPSDATLALIESQTAVIDSNEVLIDVVEKADLLNDSYFNGKGFSILGTIKDYLGLTEKVMPSPEGAPLSRIELVTLDNLRRNMSVSREPKSFVLHLSVETPSPQKSAELANLIADTFIDELGRVQSSTARRASDSLSSRLEELRASVSQAERAVEEYKRENRLVGVGGRLVDDDYILRINDQLARSRGDVTALRNKAEQMRNASVDDVVEGSFPEELTSTALNQLRDSYQKLSQQEAILSASLGPRHPRRIANAQALEAARSGIRSEVNRIVAAAETELDRAESTDQDLTAQIDTLKTKQLATSESFVRLRELEREVEASRAVYEAFLLRAREISEQERLNTANVRIISSATPPLLPSSMSRRVVVLAGFLMGFILGFGIATVWALWRPVKTIFAENKAGYARGSDGFSNGHGAARPVYAQQPAEPLPGLRESDTTLPERAGTNDAAWALRGSDTVPAIARPEPSRPELESTVSARAMDEAGSTHPESETVTPIMAGSQVAEKSADEVGIASTSEQRTSRRKWNFPKRAAMEPETESRPAAEQVEPARRKTLSETVTALRSAQGPEAARYSERVRAAARSPEEAEHMQKEIETIRERLLKLRSPAGGKVSGATMPGPRTSNVV
ncbi:GumC family protein [Fulvimarina sp. MAC3]|uniref:GumC family protein n=1 Tax=Fulvimarina sp. MAC3 TaxID=3148887 RepID=UPI0031FCF88D